MKPDDTPRQLQYIATTIALATGYYAVRAAWQLPKIHELVSELGVEEDISLGSLIRGNPQAYLFVSATILAVTLFSIWKEYRFHSLVYSIGIGILIILADRAVASALEPMLKMISDMSE
jgi:hypothetical protein